MIGVDLAMVATVLSPHGGESRYPSFPLLRLAFLVLIGCICSTFVHGDLADDERGLTVFGQAVDASKSLQWNANDVCQWQGIKCMVLPTQTSLRVTAIRLPGAGLLGPIPSGSISQLTQLRVISLRSNKLSGGLPSDLTNCSFLRSIYLQDNELSGPLPSNFSLWPNLRNIDLSNNNFSGEMPASMADMKQLKSLLLQDNSLTGSIPALNMSTLTKLNVSYNHFTGPIPTTSTYARFNQSSFLGNNLCGGPLLPCSYPPVPAPFSVTPYEGKTHKKKLSGGAIAGIVIAAVVLFLLVCLICCLVYKKSNSKSTKRANPYEARSAEVTTTATGHASKRPAKNENMAAALVEPQRKGLVFIQGNGNKYSFDLEDLLRASAEVLGKGSVGTSYKAILEMGSIVAVKRLKDVSIEKKDFEQRMEQIGQLKHENLVPLVAYYYSREEKLLVSNYMTNGSLSALLHGNKEVNRTPLDWDTRVRIALGSAHGINYLHEEGFTHGNIKSSNILLTSNYNGCVSDYGLTQLVNVSPAANRMGVGYRAPELVDPRKPTPKTDVYSYGVLLLELLTGRPPSHEEGLDLPRWVQSVSRGEEEWMSKVFDEQLTIFAGVEDEMASMLDIALQCVKPSPDQRPTMDALLVKLQHYKQHDGSDEY